MCASCGCGDATHVEHHGVAHIHGAHGHSHDHPHDHGNGHVHADELELPRQRRGREVEVQQSVLAKNDHQAEMNRAWLAARGALALNWVSSPGSGKTTLLERLIGDLGPQVPIRVVEGDQETDRDAERIRKAGAPAVQVNTGTGCHLDATMVAGALQSLSPPARSLVLIENVGNLVCPSLFDLGEHAKVLVASVTEGEDKPFKYPHMFRAARALVLNKVDLLPHVRFEVSAFLAAARQVNPHQQVFPISAYTGEGLSELYQWVLGELSQAAAQTLEARP